MNRFAHTHGTLRDVQEERWKAFVQSASKAHAAILTKSRNALVLGGPDGLEAHHIKAKRLKEAFDARMLRLDEEFFGRRDYATTVQFNQAAE